MASGESGQLQTPEHQFLLRFHLHVKTVLPLHREGAQEASTEMCYYTLHKTEWEVTGQPGSQKHESSVSEMKQNHHAFQCAELL